MTIDTQSISDLRNKTGAGIMEVRKALEEANGDAEKATDILRKSGVIKAAKKADRVAADGLVYAYIHGAGKIGAMVQLACETDFVARTDDYKELVKTIAMHIAAAAPQYLKAEDVPGDVTAKELEIYREQLAGENKPAEVLEKIMHGKITKFYEEVCLLKQKSIHDDTKTIEDLISEASAKVGEKIEIVRFARFSF